MCLVGSSGLSPLLLCADRGRVLSGINPASHRCALGKGRTLGTPRGSWPHFEGRWSWGQAVWGGNSEWCRRVLTSSVPGREPPVLCPGALVTRPRTGRACLPPWRLGCWKRRWYSPGHLNLSFPSSRKMATNFLVHEKIWFDKFKYDDAERKFYEQMNGPAAGSSRQVGAVPPASGRVGTGTGTSHPGALLQVLAAGSLAGWPWLAPGVLALLLPR